MATFPAAMQNRTQAHLVVTKTVGDYQYQVKGYVELPTEPYPLGSGEKIQLLPGADDRLRALRLELEQSLDRLF